MAWQNRQVLDWILAEKGDVCMMFGDHCCTFHNTAPHGSFTEALMKLHDLREEVHPNAGHDKYAWDWFDLNLGKRGEKQWKVCLSSWTFAYGDCR